MRRTCAIIGTRGEESVLKRALAFIVFALASAALSIDAGSSSSTPALTASAVPCHGAYRWRVKTLSDTRAKLVDHRALPTALDPLRRLQRPGGITRATHRLPGAERRTYKLRVLLTTVVRARDHDIRLVVSDRRGRKMVVVLPDPTCSAAKHSRKRGRMAVARASFLASCGVPPSLRPRRVRGSATITGIGFFDKRGHKAFGNAPNGFELHPVVSFLGVCRPLPRR